MNKTRTAPSGRTSAGLWLSTIIAGSLLAAPGAYAAKQHVRLTPMPEAGAPCSTIESAPLVNLTVGKSFRLRTPSPVKRILLGNPSSSLAAKPKEKSPVALGQPQPAEAPSSGGVASVDVILLGPNEIYLQGRSVGSTNLILLGRTGQCTLVDVAVGVDASTLQSMLDQMVSGGGRIRATSAADSVILSGTVADATQVDKAVTLAGAYVTKVVNMLNVADPQQVMLEVKVAEVNKTLLDQLGAQFKFTGGGGWTYSFLGNFLTNPTGASGSGGLTATKAGGSRLFGIDANRQNGLVKMLAEPTVMAMSGQEGSFLAGGKIFIPVAQNSSGSGTVVTLEEKEFGVGLKFTPTVLGGGRINLAVAPEVSELSPTGVSIAGGGLFSSTVLPFMTTRRAKTTVQLMDGQSLAIGGLIKNNSTQSVNAFPILGEIPILGALFRSSNFQHDQSEVLFVITPHLVKPLPADYKLPTDNHTDPSRTEFFLEGKMEGAPKDNSQPAPAAQPSQSKAAPGGFEVK